MKRPIEVADIRKGDLIRVEGENDWAVEFRASLDKDRSHPGRGRRFLLDRPEPAVELPTNGLHLGWLTHDGQADLLVFSFNRQGCVEDASYGSVGRSTVEAWVPATAVPTEALDKLRADEDQAMGVQPFDAERKNDIRCQAINAFLDAVDA